MWRSSNLAKRDAFEADVCTFPKQYSNEKFSPILLLCRIDVSTDRTNRFMSDNGIFLASKVRVYSLCISVRVYGSNFKRVRWRNTSESIGQRDIAEKGKRLRLRTWFMVKI